MNVAIFTDPHCCEVSSIIRKFGTKYSVRLENQIQSLNWVEQVAKQYNCQAVICGGDFFNTPNLNENEITAVRDIQWDTTIQHYFLVGNHESGINDLQYNSTKMLEAETRAVIAQPCMFDTPVTEICFLPYIVESNREALNSYFPARTTKQRIVFSHNDIKGIQMGPAISQNGFTVEEIEANCDLFINGHLHNGTKITNKIINLGSLTGQTFGEDAFRYPHNIMILDTDTLKYQLIENPFAINFYKIEIINKKDLQVLQKLKNNAVVSIKCAEALLTQVQETVAQLTMQGKILESRISMIRQVASSDGTETAQVDLTLDHLAKLFEFCQERLGSTDLVEHELNEICK